MQIQQHTQPVKFSALFSNTDIKFALDGKVARKLRSNTEGIYDPDKKYKPSNVAFVEALIAADSELRQMLAEQIEEGRGASSRVKRLFVDMTVTEKDVDKAIKALAKFYVENYNSINRY